MKLMNMHNGRHMHAPCLLHTHTHTHTHTWIDGIPGSVAFRAEPDTNTSIYVSWSQATPLRTHPLLLRYEILFRDTTNDVNSTFGPFLLSQTSYIVTGLEPNVEYLVSMVATSLQGRSDVTSRSVTTFPNRKPKCT